MRASNAISPRRRASAVALALTVIAVTGCGASSSSSPTKTAAARVAATTASPPLNSANDQQVAIGAQLRLADFPAGWQQSTKTQASGKSPCQEVDGAKAAATARDASHDFSNGRDVPAVYSAVYLYEDTAAASHWFDELSSGSTRSCLAKVLAKGLTSGAAANDGHKALQITTSGAAIEPIGAERAEARLTIAVGANGSPVDLRADVIFVRVSRGIVVLTLLDTTAPFDQTLATNLASNVVERLGTGLKQGA